MAGVWSVIRFDGPDGPERYEWPAGVTQPGSPALSVQEALKVEQWTGMKPQPWMRALGELDATAWAALVALLRTRAGTPTRFTEVDFDLFSAQMLDVDEHGNVVEPVDDGGVVDGGESPNS